MIGAQGDPGYAATSVMLGETALCRAQAGATAQLALAS